MRTAAVLARRGGCGGGGGRDSFLADADDGRACRVLAQTSWILDVVCAFCFVVFCLLVVVVWVGGGGEATVQGGGSCAGAAASGSARTAVLGAADHHAQAWWCGVAWVPTVCRCSHRWRFSQVMYTSVAARLSLLNAVMACGMHIVK